MADTAKRAEAAEGRKGVFLFFASSEIMELIAFSTESKFHCEVSAYSDVRAALPALKSHKFDLAVIDSSLTDGMVVFEQLNGMKIPFVLHHPEGKSPDVRGPKIKAFTEKELLPAIFEALTSQSATPREAQEGVLASIFVRVSAGLLVRTSPLASDLFLRLSDLKFVKIFHKGAVFSKEDQEKYEERKKIPYFFVKHDAVDAVAKKINALLEALLKKSGTAAESAPVKVDTVETMHELVRQVGFTPEVQKLVKNNMNLVIQEMQSSPSLSGILSSMERNKDKYIAAHSQMLAEVSCALAIAMEWGSDMSLKKIAMAALLHDMSITNQKLCAVKSLKELESRREEFGLDAQEEYKNHTKKAAVLIQGMKEVPADVDKIVYQHHELPRGTGFPEGAGHTHIHPLAATLMVAHDLVDWVIDHPGPIDMPGFIEAHKEKYQVGSFKKILKALETFKI